MTGDRPSQKSVIAIDTGLFVNAVGALLLAGIGGVVTSLWSINRDVGALYAAAELAAEQDAELITALTVISENNVEEALALERLVVQVQMLDARILDLEVRPAAGK